MWAAEDRKLEKSARLIFELCEFDEKAEHKAEISALLAERGILSARLNPRLPALFITYYPRLLSAKAIEKKVIELGLKLKRVLPELTISESRPILNMRNAAKQYILALSRLIISALALISGIIGEYFNFSNLTSSLLAFLAWLSFWPAHLAFISALRAKRPNMDMLASMSSSAILCYGFLLLLFPNIFGAYFANWHYLALITTSFNFTDWLEHRYELFIARLLERFSRIIPTFARRIGAKGEEIIPQSEVRSGDMLLIRPGEQVPADGVVSKGLSSVDESMLTAERIAALKSCGAYVYAGTFNQTGWFEFRAERTGEDTAIMRVLKDIKASRRIAKCAKAQGDKIAAWFVPLILLCAIITAFIWMLSTFNYQAALSAFVAVISFACPCAAALALPAAIAAGFSYAKSKGVLIKNLAALPLSHKIDTLVFGMSGVLSTDSLALKSLCPVLGTDLDLLRLMALSQYNSSCPLALSIKRSAKARGIYPKGVLSSTLFHGRGVKTQCQEGQIIAGSLAFLEENGINIPPEQAAKFLGINETYVLLALNGKFQGYALFAASVNPDILPMLSFLRRLKIMPVLVSGNSNAAAAAASGTDISLPYPKAGLEDRKDIIAIYKALGRSVAAVGSGFEDAAALAYADIGISLSFGTDFSKAASDIILEKSGLENIVKSLFIARKIYSLLASNMRIAFAFNLAALIGIAGIFQYLGFKPPPSAFAQASILLSGAAIIINSLRKWFR